MNKLRDIISILSVQLQACSSVPVYTLEQDDSLHERRCLLSEFEVALYREEAVVLAIRAFIIIVVLFELFH